MNEAIELYHIVRGRVAYHLRRIRTAQGLTQEAVARRAGLAVRHVQKIEAAQLNLTLKSLAKLANALGVDPGELLSETNREDERWIS